MGDDRPARYIENDRIIYRASSLGACDRAIIACARGVPAMPWPEKFQEVLDEGTRFEGAIDAMWQSETGFPTDGQQNEYELEIGESAGKTVVVRCHIDGISGSSEARILREYKKFRDSTWPNFLRQGVEVHENYPWQVSVMMHAGEFDECEFVGGHVVDGELTEVHCQYLVDPPFSFNAIRKRVMRWEKLIAAGMDVQDVDCRGDYPCAYFKVHDEKPATDPAEHVIDTSTDLGRQIAAWTVQIHDAAARAKSAENEKRMLTNGLKDALESLGAVDAKKVKVGDWQIVHVVKNMPERITKAHVQSYYQVKEPKETK